MHHQLRRSAHTGLGILLLAWVSCIEPETDITYSAHIAPVIYRHCTPCHRPGSAGTFDLLTYEDVKNRAATIALVTRSRFMPPWPADPSYSHFRDEKYMPVEDIELIKKWVDAGAPLGNTEKIPPVPDFSASGSYSKPDLILHFDKSFFIAGNNKDHFMMMKVPFEFPADTFIKAIEIVPGNKKLVHHINAHLVQYEPGSKKEFRKGERAVNTEEMSKQQAFEKLGLQNDDGTYPMLTPSVTNYLPGVETSFNPEGIGGYRVKKNGVLLLDNIHYGPSPVDTTDSTTFHVYFQKEAPRRPVSEFIIGTSGIAPVEPPLVIPPGSVKSFRSQYTLPGDMSLLTVNPHMHLLGKSFLAYAVKPGGDTVRIIRIPEWDFRWQYFYTFPKILHLPKGSTIHTEGVFDNTDSNPLNPFSPPRVVAEREGSMRTTDEMFQLIVTYMPYKPGDENISLELNAHENH